jgi:hypothetical protein
MLPYVVSEFNYKHRYEKLIVIIKQAIMSRCSLSYLRNFSKKAGDDCCFPVRDKLRNFSNKAGDECCLLVCDKLRNFSKKAGDDCYLLVCDVVSSDTSLPMLLQNLDTIL